MSVRGDQRKFLREVERAGAVVERRRGKGAHAAIFVNGRLVASVGATGTKGYSNDQSATRRALRAAGLDIRSH